MANLRIRVQQHLENSRIEFLKAIREVIDDRIEHLSKAGNQGIKISVDSGQSTEIDFGAQLDWSKKRA